MIYNNNNNNWDSLTFYKKQAIAKEDHNMETKNLLCELEKGHFEQYSHSELLSVVFTTSPLRVKNKADLSKRWTHYLLYPPDNHTSINSQIYKQYTTVEYSTIDKAIATI